MPEMAALGRVIPELVAASSEALREQEVNHGLAPKLEAGGLAPKLDSRLLLCSPELELAAA
jgi:hypothetical protein